MKISLNGRNPPSYPLTLFSLSLSGSIFLAYQCYIVLQLSDSLFSEFRAQFFFGPLEKIWISQALQFKNFPAFQI